jgi:hypothetical protein
MTAIIASIILIKENPMTLGAGIWAGARTVCYTCVLLLFINAFIVSTIPMRTTEVKQYETTNETVDNANGEQIYFFHAADGELRAISVNKMNIREEEWADKPILIETHKEYKNFFIKSILLKEFESKIEYEIIKNPLY